MRTATASNINRNTRGKLENVYYSFSDDFFSISFSFSFFVIAFFSIENGPFVFAIERLSIFIRSLLYASVHSNENWMMAKKRKT